MKRKSRKHTGATRPQRVGVRGEPGPSVDEEETSPPKALSGTGNDLLESGQLRGVDEDDNVVSGLHRAPPPRKPQIAARRHGDHH